jgi:hypothetical protein
MVEARKVKVGVKKTVGGGLSLPQKANVPPNDLWEYCLFLYGVKGIGKSSVTAECPNSLSLMAEPGRRNLKIKQVPQQGEKPLDWTRVKGYLDLCLVEGIRPIFDTVDKIYQLCVDHVAKSKGYESPYDAKDHGATWNAVAIEFQSTINKLILRGTRPIFISHCRLRPLQLDPLKKPGWSKEKNAQREGLLYEGDDSVQPTCAPACFEYLKAIADFAFYYGYVEQERAIYVRGSSLIWAACGTSDNFLHPKTKEPLMAIPMGKSPKEAYKNLTNAFHNKVDGWIVPDTEEE